MNTIVLLVILACIISANCSNIYNENHDNRLLQKLTIEEMNVNNLQNTAELVNLTEMKNLRHSVEITNSSYINQVDNLLNNSILSNLNNKTTVRINPTSICTSDRNITSYNITSVFNGLFTLNITYLVLPCQSPIINYLSVSSILHSNVSKRIEYQTLVNNGFEVSTIEQCREICDNDPFCNAFFYDTSNSTIGPVCAISDTPQNYLYNPSKPKLVSTNFDFATITNIQVVSQPPKSYILNSTYYSNDIVKTIKYFIFPNQSTVVDYVIISSNVYGNASVEAAFPSLKYNGEFGLNSTIEDCAFVCDSYVSNCIAFFYDISNTSIGPVCTICTDVQDAASLFYNQKQLVNVNYTLGLFFQNIISQLN